MSLLFLLFVALLPFVAFCEDDDKPAPATELQALKDMQAMLERLGDDHTEQPHEREATLSALARVREALDSWPASIPYYDKVLSERPGGGLCAWALSGAMRARVARDGALAGARAYLAKDAMEAAQGAGDMVNHINRLKGHFDQISKFLSAGAAKHGPGIHPLANVHFAKGEEPSFWKIVAPPWIYPPPPAKPVPNQPPVSTPATALKSSPGLGIAPIVLHMERRLNPMVPIAVVQPDLRKRIELLPDQPAAK